MEENKKDYKESMDVQGEQETQQLPPNDDGNGEKTDGGGELLNILGREVPKKKAIAVGLGGLLVLALAGGGAWCAMNQKPHGTETAPVAQEDKKEAVAVQIGAKADGWVAGESSPVIAHIVNETEKVDYYHAYDANVSVGLDVPAGGDYKVSFITPVNKDGSIYEVPAETVVEAEEKDTGAKVAGEGTLPFTFKPIKTGDASTDDLNAVVEAVTEAVKKGDETLSGENGTKVIETVKANIKANGNADEKKVEEGSKKAEEAKPSDGKDKGSEPQKGAGTATATGGSPSNGSSSNQSQGGSTGNGGNSSGTASKPQHTHNWVAQTTTVHHDAQYQTVHHDAVYDYRSICNGCGADITGNVDAHMQDALLNGNTACGAYHTENILVSAAWDEQKLIQDAYDETVNTGRYTCSCGAVK